jgi:hypothetical protein
MLEFERLRGSMNFYLRLVAFVPQYVSSEDKYHCVLASPALKSVVPNTCSDHGSLQLAARRLSWRIFASCRKIMRLNMCEETELWFDLKRAPIGMLSDRYPIYFTAIVVAARFPTPLNFVFWIRWHHEKKVDRKVRLCPSHHASPVPRFMTP